MSIWFFIWLSVSLLLLGFSAWTFYIVLQQKKAWREFSKKNKLRYRKTSFMNSPKINGLYKDFALGIFTSEHQSGDGRATRKMTAIEIEMKSRLPVSGAIGSGGMVPIIQSLDFPEEFKPDTKDWSQEYIIRCDQTKILKEYLNPQRIEALDRFMKRKNIWLIYLFKPQGTILRIDTPEPLERLNKLEKTVDELIELARLLELQKEESSKLSMLKTQKEMKTPVVEIHDDEIKNITIELEDPE
jgi:hypothetical protein